MKYELYDRSKKLVEVLSFPSVKCFEDYLNSPAFWCAGSDKEKTWEELGTSLLEWGVWNVDPETGRFSPYALDPEEKFDYLIDTGESEDMLYVRVKK